MGGWWGQCRICSRDSNKGSSGTARHGMNRMSVSLYYVALSVVLKRNFMNDIGKEILIVRWWYSFFCSSSSAAALDFFRCIVQSVWGSNDMRVRAGSVFLLHKPTATEATTKQRNVQKNFRISRLFSFSLSMFLYVWVCVCVVTVVWHCGITVWNVTTIYKGMTFVKWLGKTLLKWCINMCSLSLFYFLNKRAFNMRIDECAVSTENKKNKISSLFSCQFPIYKMLIHTNDNVTKNAHS